MRGLLVLAVAVLAAAEGRVVKLTLPHSLERGETVWLEVTTGPLARGEEIEIRTEAGRLLGTISPFGARAAKRAGVYTVPAPPDAIVEGRLTVRLYIGKERRAPTNEEVRTVRLRIRPGPH